MTTWIVLIKDKNYIIEEVEQGLGQLVDFESDQFFRGATTIHRLKLSKFPHNQTQYCLGKVLAWGHGADSL